jgi:phage gp45-like
MKYTTPRDSADRHGNSLSRTTVQTVDDTTIVQNKKLNGYADETMDKIEHFHPYGFTNVVQGPTGQGENAQSAESMTMFMGSNRSHGVSIVNGDRRYRLFKLAAGEVALHDDQGHQIHIRRDGVYVSAPNSKKIVGQIMNDDTMPQDSSAMVNGQKLGQIQQAGRPVASSFSLDKNSFSVNHASTININAPTINLNGADINLNGSDKIMVTCDLGVSLVSRFVSLGIDGAKDQVLTAAGPLKKVFGDPPG